MEIRLFFGEESASGRLFVLCLERSEGQIEPFDLHSLARAVVSPLRFGVSP